MRKVIELAQGCIASEDRGLDWGRSCLNKAPAFFTPSRFSEGFLEEDFGDLKNLNN